MKKIAAALVALTVLVSCARAPGDETLLLYAQAQGAYGRGAFAQTAQMLQGVQGFMPALVLRGKALYFCDDDEGAERVLQKALKQGRSAEALLFTARIKRDRGDAEGARAIAEELIRDNPQDIRALRLASDLAAARGDGAEAAALLDKAAEAAAEGAMVFIDRAKLRWSRGNAGGALQDLARAETLLPWAEAFSQNVAALRAAISSVRQKEEAE
jgi:tetratricopeptide (TPR) repeat protein